MSFDFNGSFKNNQNSNNGRFIPRIAVLIVVIVFILALASTCIFIVDQTEQAVIMRFGKYNRTVGPGLQYKLPFGIETSYNVETQTVQTMSFGFRTTSTGSLYGSYSTYRNDTSESIMLTGDLNIIDIQWTVQYRISDPYKWLFSVNNPTQTISDISRSIINQIVGDLPILSIMSSQRSAIEVEAETLMQQKLDSFDIGVKILTVKLQDIVPPAGDVQDAFEDVNKAIQDMNKYINEGKQNYNSVIPKAEGEASKIIQEAEGYASERINTAKGDVARFEAVKAEYEKSKEITSKRLYIETMEEIFSSENTGSLTLLDKNLDSFLPISNLNLN
ncbi:MAG: FtsH protease activity modulator HflK [Sphaerochaetaceae bacterium]|nr:FtsH protease activity modulator HflK [Sphaerochaetaceae bacterium]